jgi:lipopolysaccharide transport system ATP-binding protein
MTAVQALCRRAIHLAGGSVVADGDCKTVVGQFLRSATDGHTMREWADFDSAPGSDDTRLRRIEVFPEGETPEGLLTMQAPIRIEADLVCRSNANLKLAFFLVNDEGVVVLATNSPTERRPLGAFRAQLTIPANLLNSGGYSLNFYVVRDEISVHSTDSVISFTVHDVGVRASGYKGREAGVVHVPIHWSMQVGA